MIIYGQRDSRMAGTIKLTAMQHQTASIATPSPVRWIHNSCILGTVVQKRNTEKGSSQGSFCIRETLRKFTGYHQKGTEKVQ